MMEIASALTTGEFAPLLANEGDEGIAIFGRNLLSINMLSI